MIEGPFYIEKIIYQDYRSNFSIMACSMDDEPYTILGSCDAIEGETIDFTLDEVIHPKYGKQYTIISYQRKTKKSKKTICEYIINSILDDYDYNNDKEVDVKLLKKQVKYLVDLDLNEKIIIVLVLKYKYKTIDILNKNPYVIIEDFEDLSFDFVDKIASQIGIEHDSDIRIEAAILYVLNEAAYRAGHVFLFMEELESELEKILNLNINTLDDYLINMQMNKLIVVREEEKRQIYSYNNYKKEYELSKMLFERKEDIEIITGGPGTGKTTLLKEYASNFLRLGLKILLLAPTGRAAKRIIEVTNIKAKTIHRALEFTSDRGRHFFKKNEKNKLDVDTVIVDEMSMVDLYLMHSLILALPKKTKIILVGDKDQLPAVGVGNVLSDMISSNIFNVNLLTTIHRQSQNSKIVINAHKINHKQEIDLDDNSNDFIFIKEYDAHKIIENIQNLIKENMNQENIINYFDIQVICSTKKGELGTINLNKILQNTLNPKSKDKKEIKYYTNIYRINDKVMQIKNNYDLEWYIENEKKVIIEQGFGIFNGDLGRIIDIDKKESTFIVDFDGKKVKYNYDDIKDLSLAYAMTVHKSQGSEYPIVIFPMYKASYYLLNKNLLYTGVTRAREKVYLIGLEKIFYQMEQNENENKRHSSLCCRSFLS
ncbi:MAG: AAA family ATPase [Eubacteriales bacterium]|nr:AAA family ATPase [Eubacteriales bacterium]